MASGTQQFSGWPIAEAIRRCADPDLLSQWFEARRNWVKGGRRRRFKFRSEQIEGDDAFSHNDRERVASCLYSQDLSSYARLQHSLLELLRAGSLLALGRRDSPLAPLASIPESSWRNLGIYSIRKSIAVEKTKANRIYDLRIFPFVEAPDVIERLDGKTFVEAFQICVADDPQTAVLNRRAILVHGEPVAFGYDWDSHRAVWSVEHGHNCPAGDGVGFMRKFNDPIKYNREVAAKAAAARRFARLIDFLASGQLVAEGIPAGRGGVVVVPRSIWRRHQTYLDLLNGDILELDPRADDHTTALTGPIFTALMLSRPKGHSELREVREFAPSELLRPNRSTRVVITRAKAQSDCSNWLSDLMRASPAKKTQTKAECWQQAQIKWPQKLAYRAFERAWSDAVHQSKASAWSASGRPSKSPQA